MKTNSDTTTKLYVGLDVHKEKTSIALAEPGAAGEIRSYGEVATTQIALERTLRKLAKARGMAMAELHVCYEAGGCGMWIARMLVRLKVRCTVVAPSLIPSKAGDHVKTDKRDAIKLVRLLRAGELTAVHIPDETDEAMRDLCRARVDAMDDLRRAKNRLLAMLRRLGFGYTGKTHWTEAHKRYLRDLRLPFACHRIIMEELISQIDQLVARMRWMLVECATHYQAQPRVSSALSMRQEGQPRWLKEISWKAQNRLHLRFTKLRQRLMHHNKIKVAVARELTGVLWEIGVKMQTQTTR